MNIRVSVVWCFRNAPLLTTAFAMLLAINISKGVAGEKTVTFDTANLVLVDIVKEAEVIVVGEVTVVREVVSTNAQDEQTNSNPVTEHEPQWMEAIVEVERNIRGTHPGDLLVIRFPGSQDVAWYGSPKFTVGAKGTFILKSDDMSGGPKEVEVSNESRRTFTALEPESFAPTEAADAIQALARQ